MFLRELDLFNFRSFSQEKIIFQQGLTVLVGENNGGKSNIIDAIRLLTPPLSGRRDLYCELTDIRFGSSQNSFEISATYDKLSPPQQGRLLSATITDTLEEACFGLTFDATLKKSNIRPNPWAGRFRATPEIGSHDMIRHVYLPPLRDAKRMLASGNPTRILALLNHFLGDRDPDEVAEKLARESDDSILSAVNSAVADGLDKLTKGVRWQGAALGFNTEEKLIHVARDLRFKLADKGISPEDLQYSGHGYANLLYIATIAVELAKTEDADLTVFLVEEPEAHLHPQLQAAVLNYLQEQAQFSQEKKTDNKAPAGQLQVIVATHSPNLSAWVPCENLVIIRSVKPITVESDATETISQEEEIDTAENLETTPLQIRHESRSIPIAKLDLTDLDRRKVDRYLDVTKSALLFGGRVLLVEGIAEAMLLPIIAKNYVFKDQPDKFRIFRSTAFVPIDGVDFLPYAKILLTPFGDPKNGPVRIVDHLVVVTDGDKHLPKQKENYPGVKRKCDLVQLASSIGSLSVLHVILNKYSLETELIIAGNEEYIKPIYMEFHSRSERNWDEALAQKGTNRAKAIQKLFENTPKGDFAHILAEKLTVDDTFKVPAYISRSIKTIVR
jgi:putative ATP-dependent endonuclease of OLD family